MLHSLIIWNKHGLLIEGLELFFNVNDIAEAEGKKSDVSVSVIGNETYGQLKNLMVPTKQSTKPFVELFKMTPNPKLESIVSLDLVYKMKALCNGKNGQFSQRSVLDFVLFCTIEFLCRFADEDKNKNSTQQSTPCLRRIYAPVKRQSIQDGDSLKVKVLVKVMSKFQRGKLLEMLTNVMTIKKGKVCFYITTLHFTPWQPCSLRQQQLGFSGKHSSRALPVQQLLVVLDAVFRVLLLMLLLLLMALLSWTWIPVTPNTEAILKRKTSAWTR